MRYSIENFSVPTNQVITNDPSVGRYGGECTCPNGQKYQVGDNNDYCDSLACVGGVSGPCNQYDGQWSGRKVRCGSFGNNRYLLKNNNKMIFINATSGAVSSTGYWPQYSSSFELVPSNKNLPSNKVWLRNNGKMIYIDNNDGLVKSWDYWDQTETLFELVPINNQDNNNRFWLKNGSKYIRMIDSRTGAISAADFPSDPVTSPPDRNALFELVHIDPPNTNPVNDCPFDTNTPVDNPDGCNTCINNNSCPMMNCANVCNLPNCRDYTNTTNDTCVKYGIIDLYRPIFNRFNEMVDSLDHPDVQPVNANFDSLAKNNVTERELGSLLWTSIKNLYEVNSLHTRSNFVDKKNLEKVISQQNAKLSEDSVAISDLNELNSTSKRHIEINMNKYRRVEYQLSVLKYILIAIMGLIIIPILTYANVMSKKTGMGVIVFALVIIGIVSYFFLYVKNVYRDNNDYKEFNFVKPTDEQVARSKMLSEMSKRDKARCQALAELEDDFDPASLNIDISQYINSATANNQSSCSAIQTNDYS